MEVQEEPCQPTAQSLRASKACPRATYHRARESLRIKATTILCLLRPPLDFTLFSNHVQGAVFEIRFKDPPKIFLFDGYLTVDLGYWHFHLCIGTHQGTPSPELAAKRRVARAAFFETRGGKCGGGRSWGLHLWNGFGEQMTTVFLPSPFLSEDSRC